MIQNRARQKEYDLHIAAASCTKLFMAQAAIFVASKRDAPALHECMYGVDSLTAATGPRRRKS
jgi:hypothetical protein